MGPGQGEWCDYPQPGVLVDREEYRSLPDVAAFESPERWVDRINGPGLDTPGRDNNCVDCARAAESVWRGRPEMAAAHADPQSEGTVSSRITDWSGGSFIIADYATINDRLSDLGPGASAIIVTEWASPYHGAHAHNALNDDGVVKYVDGQSGEVTELAPSWHQSLVDRSFAVFYDAWGRPQ